MIEILITLLNWYGIYEGLNFLFSLLYSFYNGYNMNKMIEYHSNSVIPYISDPKEINIIIQYFYIFNVTLLIQLINIYLWTNYFTEYLAILLTFPKLSTMIIQNKYIVEKYNKLTKKIKTYICNIISKKIINILNIVATDILDMQIRN